MKKSTPSFELRNHQRRIKVNSAALARFGERALRAAFPHRRSRADISVLDHVYVSLVSDARMTRLHAKFSNVATPTDVLTFQDGDIVISVETARRQTRIFGGSLTRELHLYLVHGILHLCGFDDRTATARAGMRRMERRILAQCETCS